MADNAEPLLQVRGLEKVFPQRGWTSRGTGAVQAVSGVDLDVMAGQTHGLVGESGCGKSTVARSIVRLDEPTGGTAQFEGRDLFGLSGAGLRAARRDIQMVFQDPFASLNPRMTVGAIVEEPLVVHGVGSATQRRARVADLLTRVGLQPDDAHRYPHQFSGGQRQRVGIARALALEPKLIVLDEPVSALDVSIQAQIVNLLADLQDELGLAYLFIAHDLAVVRQISDVVSVMYLGRIVETGARDDIFERPTHPYTSALLSAVPKPERRADSAEPEPEPEQGRIVLAGDVPSPVNPPSGCRFRTRCWMAEPQCAEEVPALVDRGHGHEVACHLV